MLFSTKLILAVGIFFAFILFVPQKAAASVIEDDALKLINSERQKLNLSPLSYSDKLYKASALHNNLMVDCAKKYGNTACFSHTVTLLNEKTLLTRIKAEGYNAQAVAENIAWGHSTAGGIVGAWMSSSGHRANIIGNYKDIGCSYTAPYWTCDFGRSLTAGSSATPTPFPTSTSTKAPSPSPTPTKTILPTIATSPTVPLPTSKPWWCIYTPTISLCQ